MKTTIFSLENKNKQTKNTTFSSVFNVPKFSIGLYEICRGPEGFVRSVVKYWAIALVVFVAAIKSVVKGHRVDDQRVSTTSTLYVVREWFAKFAFPRRNSYINRVVV